eukprot:Sspe_Gene.59361::Locus_32590_Transcript_1_1_Confidence_1.000_Length_380::g.59361::m.59361
MLRRSLRALAAAKKTGQAAPEERPVTAMTWVNTFINPIYHIRHLARIEEEVNHDKKRILFIATVVLSPFFYFFWEGPLGGSPPPFEDERPVPRRAVERREGWPLSASS